jgi:hypothetical protein
MMRFSVCLLLFGCLAIVQAAEPLGWTSGIATFTGSEVSYAEQPALVTRAAAGSVAEQDNAPSHRSAASARCSTALCPLPLAYHPL